MPFKFTVIIFTPRQGDYVFTLVCLLVSLLYCQQDYTNTNEQIFTKTPWRTGLGPEQTPLAFGADPGFLFISVTCRPLRFLSATPLS